MQDLILAIWLAESSLQHRPETFIKSSWIALRGKEVRREFHSSLDNVWIK